jgi:hypothetical protein
MVQSIVVHIVIKWQSKYILLKQVEERYFILNFCFKELIEWHRERIDCLIEGGCDLLAFETIPCTKEATALVSILSLYPKMKAWLSFSCRNDTLISNGERFKDAYNLFKDNKQLIAIGINCTYPKFIKHLFKSVERKEDDKPFIVYGKQFIHFIQIFLFKHFEIILKRMMVLNGTLLDECNCLFSSFFFPFF